MGNKDVALKCIVLRLLGKLLQLIFDTAYYGV